MASAGFVHLHVHSSYSLREGALTIGNLAKLAKADAMPALAITDTNNLFGALEFSENFASIGIQPIIGIQLSVRFGDESTFKNSASFGVDIAKIVLLAQNSEGYGNLMKLSSRAFLETDPAEALATPLRRLAEFSSGLIALSGGFDGALDRALRLDNHTSAILRLQNLAKIFKERFYIELQRHGRKAAERNEIELLQLAYEHHLPLVATNEAYFADPRQHEAHDALLCIADGVLVSTDQRRRVTPEHYLKTRSQMVNLFRDLPEALENSLIIAQRCAYRVRTRKPILPRFSVEEGEATDEAKLLHERAHKGLEQRLRAHGTASGLSLDDYRSRLDFEIDVITRMQFSGYFLIVADFIHYAKTHGIPVGPGRGSGAGSLVAYCLTITDLDPLRFGLLFERFLNPERISMPDFDIDFCQERRVEVINYVRRRYGADRVAQIITFGSFLARGVLRNVGRVLELPLGQVDRLAKLVPQNPAKPISLREAIETEPKLQEALQADPRVEQMFRIAMTLEGLYSNASTHAAGLVIGGRSLEQFVPLYRDPKSDIPATQFNMKWVESAGLVKFDFLGLKTLTVLAKATELMSKRNIHVDLSAIPLDDATTFAMLGRGETVGVFQLESAGMRRALVDMRADRFEDIIALVALYRPGPMANIATYCARKLGEEECDFYHPILESILKETFGVIIYQEQVMQIAQMLSGYSLGEADVLRRAMGKKIKSEMDKQRVRFVEGALSRGLNQTNADDIFNLLAKFADYGFNKSHAAAYALIAYQTAWLKANYPVEFIAASMSLELSNTDKLSEFRAEAHRLNIDILSPDINHSGAYFDVQCDQQGNVSIHYALAAIKGIGVSQAESIVSARGERHFADLEDFGQRLNPREVNRKVLEALAAAGALRQLEPDRAVAFASADPLLALGNFAREEESVGQVALFDGQAEATGFTPLKVPSWSAMDSLTHEFEVIGFFLSGHPLDNYSKTIEKLRLECWNRFVQIIRSGGSVHKLAATVLDRTERRTKSGSKMGIVMLSDPSGQYEAILFQEGLYHYRDLLETGKNIVVTLQGDLNGDEVRARIIDCEELDVAAARVQKGVRIFLRQVHALTSVAKRLNLQNGQPSGSFGEVFLVLMLDRERGEVEVKLPGRFPISPVVLSAVKSTPGVFFVEPF